MNLTVIDYRPIPLSSSSDEYESSPEEPGSEEPGAEESSPEQPDSDEPSLEKPSADKTGKPDNLTCAVSILDIHLVLDMQTSS